MHGRRADPAAAHLRVQRAEDASHTYVGSTAHIRRGRRVYSTEGQDCTSLQVFEIETLAAGDSASKQLENAGFVLLQAGTGTVARAANLQLLFQSNETEAFATSVLTKSDDMASLRRRTLEPLLPTATHIGSAVSAAKQAAAAQVQPGASP